ncbi:MAG: DNA polymerase III subunit gamma/tau [Candidatus Eremiobacteraeota bacterium]|nr:DNA polymerase III subunit gamma/tau [Candidatus Eremiobacteraeota bacterium]MBC5827066.1 DNA polymerase III subunit gamma/tau [Candidatus Eremiobacteraeota bacterium]
MRRTSGIQAMERQTSSISLPENVALYRKHRPPAFADLVGQPAVVQGLAAAVASGRVVHAYLFSGPRGTGKTSAARILAKCVNCMRGGPRPDPCGECEACTAIAAGTAFDVVEIDAASNRGINEIRELRERVKFAPSRLRRKVYIIDEVHMLTPEAFNALLKTLEEPPEAVLFILATTEIDKVPLTILSRCQRYEFRRMSPTTIRERLACVAAREDIAVTESALARIAYLADGALRDALVLLEQARGFMGELCIDDDALDRAFGVSHRERIEQIVDGIRRDDAKDAFSALAEAIDDGADPKWLARELLRFFRHALISLVGARVLESEMPLGDAEAIAAHAAQLGRTKVLVALRCLSECVAARFSPAPRIDLELALARIMLPADELTMQSLTDRLRTVEERLAQAPPAKRGGPDSGDGATVGPRTRSIAKAVPKSTGSEQAGGMAESLTTAKLQGLWQIILSGVKERSRTCHAWLQHASVAEANVHEVTLSTSSKYFADSLAESTMAAIIVDALSEATGVRPSIRFTVSAKVPPELRAPPSAVAFGDFSLAESVLGADLL